MAEYKKKPKVLSFTHEKTVYKDLKFNFYGLVELLMEYSIRSMWLSCSEKTISIYFFNSTKEELKPFYGWMKGEGIEDKLIVKDFLVSYNSRLFVFDIEPPHKNLIIKQSKIAKSSTRHFTFKFLSGDPFIGKMLASNHWILSNDFFSEKTCRHIFSLTSAINPDMKKHKKYHV